MINVKEVMQNDAVRETAKEITIMKEQGASIDGAVARFNYLNREYDEFKVFLNSTDRAAMPDEMKMIYTQFTVAFRRAIDAEWRLVKELMRK